LSAYVRLLRNELQLEQAEKVDSVALMPLGGTRGARAARQLLLTLSVLTLCMPGESSHAADPVQIETALVAEVRVESVAQGRPTVRFEPATAIVQGTTVYYTVRIHNPTPAPVRDVVTVQRIPVNTSYVIGSAAGPAAELTFSIDGGQTFAFESDLKVVEPSGVERKAMSAEYTHIRWRLRNALAPGATALARFQAVFR
jgi:uncharacterized repeat protein (TIGR01451 family)